MKKFFFFSAFFFISNVLFSQSADGYWDNIRTTSETITLTPRERIYVRTQDFPIGTTEVVYRITVLDDNQKLSNSLFSVLKSIPDPTGISQGSAGAVLLLTTISGDDKCKYGIFNSEILAKKYVENSKIDAACFFQNNPINKEAKLISNTTKCNIDKSNHLYFAFTSDNWFMKQKVVLEVVPWVNIKASKGWNAVAKQEVLALLKLQNVYKFVNNKNSFAAIFLEELMQKQSYPDFKLVLDIEKNNLVEKSIQSTLIKTGEIKSVLNQFRKQAQIYFTDNNLEQAIALLTDEIIEKGVANASDYCTVGRFYLFSKQFDKAFQFLKKAEDLDSAQIAIQLNMAHVFLFTDKISEAKNIHKKYKLQNISATISWKAQTNEDFKLFEDRGFESADFRKILSIL